MAMRLFDNKRDLLMDRVRETYSDLPLDTALLFAWLEDYCLDSHVRDYEDEPLHDWLNQVRDEAFAAAEQAGLPEGTMRDNEAVYTWYLNDGLDSQGIDRLVRGFYGALADISVVRESGKPVQELLSREDAYDFLYDLLPADR